MATIRSRRAVVYGPTTLDAAAVALLAAFSCQGLRAFTLHVSATNGTQIASLAIEVSDDAVNWTAVATMGSLTSINSLTGRDLSLGGGYLYVHPSAAGIPCLGSNLFRVLATIAGATTPPDPQITGLTAELTTFADNRDIQ